MTSRTMHRRNQRGAGPQSHYAVLTYLQNGGTPTVAAIAETLQINCHNVRKHLYNLELEGMVVTGIVLKDFVITLTDDGANWQAPKELQPADLQPCGHPVTRILPNGKCHDCHNEQRRIDCKNNKYLPTLRVQMR
jgi:hypothetical protein